MEKAVNGGGVVGEEIKEMTRLGVSRNFRVELQQKN